jgi:cell division protein FtsL
MSRGETLALALVTAATVVSALGVVWVKHQNRKAIAELAALRTERDALEVEWDRLLLEQSAWATPPRIEQLAREQLGMVLPEAQQVTVVRP